MKKIGLICLAVVLAVGAIGFGYANWSQTLTITEEVNTGDFCVGIRDVGTNDEGPSLADGGELYPDPDYPETEGTVDPGYTKNVGSANSVNGTYKCTHEDVDFYEDVTETITNAYPSYRCTITLEFANCGSVPAKGQSFTKATTNDPDGLAQFVVIEGWEIFDDAGGSVTTGVTVAELETALQAYQLDPCDTMTLTITKHILQDVGEVTCPELGTCTFVETVTWVQWNAQ